jgi:hypothetical protein
MIVTIFFWQWRQVWGNRAKHHASPASINHEDKTN